MASVSVVGQHSHILDPEMLFEVKKVPLPRKASWEKMIFRRSSVSSGDSGSASKSAAVKRAVMPGEGYRATAPPRSADADRQEHDRRPRQSQNGHVSRDCNNTNTSDRKRPSVMPDAAVANGHKGAHGKAHHSVPSGCSQVDNGSLPLERLTQGRTGVVRLVRTEPPRREAWAIFPLGEDPRVKRERGEGHQFEAKAVTQDWCDACSCQITTQSLKCQNCSYTCHLECESHVQLDCNQRNRKPEKTSRPRSHCSTPSKKVEAKEEEEGTKDLSKEEVWQRIEEYNSQVSENGMNLAADGSYTGFIKVHLRLSRPVTVPALDEPGTDGQTANHNRKSSDDQEESDCVPTEKRTSFYLPCDCVKQLHISSLTTTREVIQGLLKKFMVLDNPRKFALYRQTHRDGQDLFQKLPLFERPLLLRLIAGPDPEQLSFVLKENETGEVEWHAFSVPELQNFLVILEKEEAERVRTVEQKYTIYRKKLEQALQQQDP